MAPIYRAAVHAAKIFFKTDIDHRQVKGLFSDDDNPDEIYRPYKNIIERFFGTYKAHYKRHKSFSSFDDKPPLIVEGSRGQPIESRAQLIKWISKTDQ